jgi:hypothetical protein
MDWLKRKARRAVEGMQRWTRRWISVRVDGPGWAEARATIAQKLEAAVARRAQARDAAAAAHALLRKAEVECWELQGALSSLDEVGVVLGRQ